MTKFRILTTAAILALAGCGGDAKPGMAPTSAAHSPPQPPLAQHRYEDPQSLVAALETAGIACAGYDETEDVIGAVARGSCYIGNNEVVVSIYATSADANAHPQAKADLLAGVADVNVVVGANWTTSCDLASDCQRIAEATAGSLVHIPA